MLSMTDLCSAVENRKFIRQKYNFNMSLMLTGPSTKKTVTWVIKVTILVDVYLVVITLYKVFSDLCPGVQMTIFKYY